MNQHALSRSIRTYKDKHMTVMDKYDIPDCASTSYVLYKDTGLATLKEIRLGIKGIFGVQTEYRDHFLPLVSQREYGVSSVSADEVIIEGVPEEVARSIFDQMKASI